MIYLILVLIFIFIFFGIVYIFFDMAFVKKKSPDLDDLDSSANEYLRPFIDELRPGMEFIKKFPIEEVTTVSFDGLCLYGRYFDNKSKKTILLFHGYRSSACHDFCGALKFYYDSGFNILLVDQRSHGKSQGKLITFGVKESYDVVSWAEFVNAKYNPEQIVLSGISMGASTVLFALKHKLPKNVLCVIADCGFTSPREIILKVGKERFKIDANFFMPFLNLFCHLFGRFSINESIIDVLKINKIPIMLIHGENDSFVPCEMSKTVLKVAGNNANAIFVKNADHGTSYLIETERVTKEISDFLSKKLH